jgi:hypothetical protein
MGIRWEGHVEGKQHETLTQKFVTQTRRNGITRQTIVDADCASDYYILFSPIPFHHRALPNTGEDMHDNTGAYPH